MCRAVAVADLAVSGWAMVVLGMRWPCSGFLCGLVDPRRPARAAARRRGGCVLATAVLAAVTGGLARAGAGQLAALTLTTVIGGAATVGAVLVLVVATIAVAAAVNLLLTLVERI